jgi:hypothetical protein
MKFIADNMLGKLAKWLRFMGYDTLYPKTLNDNELAQLSKQQIRILLTRDKELAKKKGVQIIYIKSENLDDQLRQIIIELNLKLDSNTFCRCPECNSLLNKIDKAQLNGNVPDGVLQRHKLFWVCKNCTRYYWQGTHYKKIKSKLEEMFH